MNLPRNDFDVGDGVVIPQKIHSLLKIFFSVGRRVQQANAQVGECQKTAQISRVKRLVQALVMRQIRSEEMPEAVVYDGEGDDSIREWQLVAVFLTTHHGFWRGARN